MTLPSEHAKEQGSVTILVETELMVCPCDGKMVRRSRALIQKSIPVPFVVSPSIPQDGPVECSPERVEGPDQHTLKFLGSYRIHGSVLFHLSLCHARFPRSDACCPALLMDALLLRRALFEPFDPSTSSGLRTSSASWLALL